MEIYIVTNPEAGWDCIVGAYSSIESLFKVLNLPAELKTHDDLDDYFNKLKKYNFIVHKQYLV